MLRERPHRPVTHRRRRRGRPGDRFVPEREPRISSVFRRDDDTVCHGRCRQPLTLQGIRGLLEADFYCYTCLAHVTVPLSVLRTVLFPEVVESAAAAGLSA